jgi:hypothetical protein
LLSNGQGSIINVLCSPDGALHTALSYQGMLAGVISRVKRGVRGGYANIGTEGGSFDHKIGDIGKVLGLAADSPDAPNGTIHSVAGLRCVS